jgi:hypothetical protein
MSDNLLPLLIVGICAFGVVFMLLGVVVFNSATGIFRRFFIVGIINKVIGDVKDDVGRNSRSARLQPHTRSDLRARTRSLDFDEALSKYTAIGPGRSGQERRAPASDEPDDDDGRPRVIRRQQASTGTITKTTRIRTPAMQDLGPHHRRLRPHPPCALDCCWSAHMSSLASRGRTSSPQFSPS